MQNFKQWNNDKIILNEGMISTAFKLLRDDFKEKLKDAQKLETVKTSFEKMLTSWYRNFEKNSKSFKDVDELSKNYEEFLITVQIHISNFTDKIKLNLSNLNENEIVSFNAFNEGLFSNTFSKIKRLFGNKDMANDISNMKKNLKKQIEDLKKKYKDASEMRNNMLNKTKEEFKSIIAQFKQLNKEDLIEAYDKMQELFNNEEKLKSMMNVEFEIENAIENETPKTKKSSLKNVSTEDKVKKTSKRGNKKNTKKIEEIISESKEEKNERLLKKLDTLHKEAFIDKFTI